MFGSPVALEGRVALITGAGRRAGIGFAVARRLLDLGASVVAQAWTPYDVSAWNASPTEADAVFDELKELGPVKQIPADFAQPESPRRGYGRCQGRLRPRRHPHCTDDLPMCGKRLRIRLRSQLVQELRRPLDIGEEKSDSAGRKLPLHAP